MGGWRLVKSQQQTRQYFDQCKGLCRNGFESSFYRHALGRAVFEWTRKRRTSLGWRERIDDVQLLRKVQATRAQARGGAHFKSADALVDAGSVLGGCAFASKQKVIAPIDHEEV